MFKPTRIIPNTLDPSLDGLDWDVINAIFAPCLDPSSPASVLTPEEIENLLNRLDRLSKGEMRDAKVQGKGKQDAAISNLEGGTSVMIAAKRWAENGNQVGGEDEDQGLQTKGKEEGAEKARKERLGMGARMKRVLLKALGLPILEDWDEDEDEAMDGTQEHSAESQESVVRAANEVWKHISARENCDRPTRIERSTSPGILRSQKPSSPSKPRSFASKSKPSLSKLSSVTERHVPIAHIPVRVFPWSPIAKRPSETSTKRLKYDSSRTRLYEEEVHSDEETQRDGSGSAMEWVMAGCKDKVGSSDVEAGGEDAMDVDAEERVAGIEARGMTGQEDGMVEEAEPEAEVVRVVGTPKKSNRAIGMPLTPEPEPEVPRPRKKGRNRSKTIVQEDYGYNRLTKRMQIPPPTAPNAKKTFHHSPPPEPSSSNLSRHTQPASASHILKRKRDATSSHLQTPSSTSAAISALPGQPTTDPASLKNERAHPARERLDTFDFLPCTNPLPSPIPDLTTPILANVNNRPSPQHHSHAQFESQFNPALASQDDSEATHVEHRRKRKRIEKWLDEDRSDATVGRDLEENTRFMGQHSASDVLPGSPQRRCILPKDRSVPASPAKSKVRPTPTTSTPLPSILSIIPFAVNPSSSQKHSTSVEISPLSQRPLQSVGSSGTGGTLHRRARTEEDENEYRILKLLRVLRPNRAGSRSTQISTPELQERAK